MIFSILPFVFFVNITIPKITIPDPSEIVRNTETMIDKKKEDIKKYSASLTYKDAEFTNPSNNFSIGDLIYIKVESQGNGDTVKKIKLLNSDKNLLEEKELKLSNGNSNIFTAILKAPEEQGVYYIDIEIKGNDGYSVSMENNINIASGNDTSVSSSAASITSSQNTSSATSKVIIDNEINESTIPTQIIETKKESTTNNNDLISNLKQSINNLFEKVKGIFKF